MSDIEDITPSVSIITINDDGDFDVLNDMDSREIKSEKLNETNTDEMEKLDQVDPLDLLSDLSTPQLPLISGFSNNQDVLGLSTAEGINGANDSRDAEEGKDSSIDDGEVCNEDRDDGRKEKENGDANEDVTDVDPVGNEEQEEVVTGPKRNRYDPEYIPENLKFFDGWLYEYVEDDTKKLRCNLCDRIFIYKTRGRHSNTQSHVSLWKVFNKKMEQFKSNEKSNESLQDGNDAVSEITDWESLQVLHPWIMPAPTDPKQAYCKLCEKIVVLGSSEIKRFLHEDSFSHAMMVERQKKDTANTQKIDDNNRNEGTVDEQDDEEGQDKSAERSEDEERQEEDEEDDDEEDDEEEDEEEASSEEEEEESDEEEENVSEKSNRKPANRFKRGSVEWLKRYPWLRACKKDSRYYFCIFCKVLLKRIHFNPKKHMKTSRHIETYKEHTIKTLKEKRKTVNGALGSEFPWLVDLGADSSLVFCTYCSVYFSRSYRKKEHANTQKHREAAARHEATNNVFSTKKLQVKLNNTAPAAVLAKSSIKKSAYAITSSQMKVAKWKERINACQKSFPWCSYKTVVKNYCVIYCNLCQTTKKISGINSLATHQSGVFHTQKEQEKKNQGRRQAAPQTKAKSTKVMVSENAEEEQEIGMRQVEEVRSGQYNELIGRANLNRSSKQVDARKPVRERKLWSDILAKYQWLDLGKNTRNSDIYIDYSKSRTVNCLYCKRTFAVKYLSHIVSHGSSLAHRNADEELQKTQRSKKSVTPNEKEVQKSTSSNHDELATNDALQTENNVTPTVSVEERRASSASLSVDSTSVQPVQTTPQTQQQAHQTTPAASAAVTASAPDPLDFFFDSLRSTMKTLPQDLASEGKFKMMEILCSLEMRAYKRTRSRTETDSQAATPTAIICLDPPQEMNSNSNRLYDQRTKTTSSSARTPQKSQSCKTESESNDLPLRTSQDSVQQNDGMTLPRPTQSHQQQFREIHQHHRQQSTQVPQQQHHQNQHQPPAKVPRIAVIADARTMNSFNNAPQHINRLPRNNNNSLVTTNYDRQATSSIATQRPSNSYDSQHEAQFARKVPRINIPAPSIGTNQSYTNSNKGINSNNYYPNALRTQPLMRPVTITNGNSTNARVSNGASVLKRPQSKNTNSSRTSNDFEFIQVISDTGTEIITLSDETGSQPYD